VVFGPIADWQLSKVEVGMAAVRDSRSQAAVVDQVQSFAGCVLNGRFRWHLPLAAG
jgi:hypothetical protein